MNIYLIILTVLYSVFLIFSYIFIVKRLKHINDKHVSYTKIQELNLIFNSLKKIIFILFIVLFLIVLFLILKFAYA